MITIVTGIIFTTIDTAQQQLLSACTQQHWWEVRCEQQHSMQVGEGRGWQWLKANEVANVAWGLATARHCTPAMDHIMLTALQPTASHQGLLPAGLAELRPRQVTALLWGCAVLLQQPGAVLDNLACIMHSNQAAAGQSTAVCFKEPPSVSLYIVNCDLGHPFALF